jgi:hypothetical protein
MVDMSVREEHRIDHRRAEGKLVAHVPLVIPLGHATVDQNPFSPTFQQRAAAGHMSRRSNESYLHSRSFLSSIQHETPNRRCISSFFFRKTKKDCAQGVCEV